MSRHDSASSLNDMLNFTQKAVRFCEGKSRVNAPRLYC
jgi:hypothetical protein